MHIRYNENKELVAQIQEGLRRKVNVDEQPAIAQAFQVSSIPLLIVVKDGSIVQQSVGYQPKESVLKLLSV